MKNILFSLLLICSSLPAAEQPLIVGTNAEFPPFCYIENKTIVGFDIDVAKEVAKRLGRPIQIKDMPFDALIPDVALGKVDFVAAGLSQTEERAKRVLFTNSYFGDPLVIFTTAKQKPTLENKTVVVVEGFTADLFMSKQKNAKLIRLPNQADCFMAVKTGRADAFITAQSTVGSFLKSQDASQYLAVPIEQTAETCALALPPQNSALLIAIQKALDAMETDGTMVTLKLKWDLQ